MVNFIDFTIIFHLAWCLTPEETQKYIDQKVVYSSIYRKCNKNCETKPKINLNKQLHKYYKELEDPAMENLILRKVSYQMKMWEPTEYKMSEQQFQDKYDWLLKHGFDITLHHTNDLKFRHEPAKFMTFYTNVWLIEEILNKNPNLKRYICGEGKDNFGFTELFLATESEFFQHHHRQISRTERTENIQFDSYHTLAGNITDYSFNYGTDKLPLSDPPRL